MPSINGTIVTVSNETSPGWVAINRGSDQGVKRGFTFDVYKGGTYKGRVLVETVEADMCVARIDMTATGSTIATGDNAATKL